MSEPSYRIMPVAWTTQVKLDLLKEKPEGSSLMWGEPLPHHSDIPLYDAAALTAAEERGRREERERWSAEPVGWVVKDFADGWILCRTEKGAKFEAQDTGALILPVHAAIRGAQEAGE